MALHGRLGECQLIPTHVFVYLALTKNMISPHPPFITKFPKISALERWDSGGKRGSIDRREHLVSMRRDWRKESLQGATFQDPRLVPIQRHQNLHCFLVNVPPIKIISSKMAVWKFQMWVKRPSDGHASSQMCTATAASSPLC